MIQHTQTGTAGALSDTRWKEKTLPFGVNSMRSPVLYRAAGVTDSTPKPARSANTATALPERGLHCQQALGRLACAGGPPAPAQHKYYEALYP